MTEDARFEDAPLSDRPLRLRAETVDDLQVVSSLLQDAVGRAGDVKWLPRRRRLVLLVNRFRWEDAPLAERQRRAYERVRSALIVEGVLAVRARGISPAEPDVIFSALALAWEPAEDGAGRLVLTIAGDGDVVAEAECLDVSLADLTRPWQAVSGKAPAHQI